MKTLAKGEKDEWNTEFEPRLMRTGCHDLWDAVFWSLREYRDSTSLIQKKMIHDRAKIQNAERNKNNFKEQILEEYKKTDDNPERKLFFFLISLRLIHSELFPYIDEMKDEEDIETKIIEKCQYLTSLSKKFNEEYKKDTDEIISDYLREVFEHGQNKVSYDDIQNACKNLEYHVILLSPTETILFDSFSWRDGIPGSEFWDNIVVLAHPDNTYDSVGRTSFTKENYQKISRIYHSDDAFIETLRKKSI